LEEEKVLNPVLDMRIAYFGLLTGREMTALVMYLADHATQQEIALEVGIGQTGVSKRVRRAAGKLRAVGLPIELPGRGRRKTAPPLARCDPRWMDRLSVAEKDGSGRMKGRWINAKRTDYHTESRSEVDE
jgi:hypothetical protein